LDIVVRNATLRGAEAPVDIGIAAGAIAAIESSLEAIGASEVDAQGMLVTPSFANPHLHLCKVWTLDRMDESALTDYHGETMGKAMTAIESAARVKADYDRAWIVPNARRAAALAALHGNTHIRAFADVDSQARLEAVESLIEVRDEFRGVVDIQVVAFAQDGLAREPGASEMMRRAMEAGADVVGGIPWIEYTDEDMQAHIDEVFALAAEFDKPVSMLVDDAGDAGLRTLEMMARKTVEQGWEGRALAHHARAMSLYPKPYLQKIAALLKRADMGVVTDPHTGPLHARVGELLEEGVLVCLGQDDISDAYYPLGRNSMLEVAFLAVHLLWMTTREDMERLYSMITCDAGRAMGVDLRTEVGAPAHLVVLGEPNVREALRTHAEPRHVISHGKLIDRTVMEQALVV